jgi:hypothetical protein
MLYPKIKPFYLTSCFSGYYKVINVKKCLNLIVEMGFFPKLG